MEDLPSKANTMKAVIISKKGNIKYKEVQEPKTSNGYVKVKVKAAGLCGSDIQKIFSDKKALKSIKTNVMGHEIAGIIHEIGNNVKMLKRGDKVVINPLIRDKSDDITKTKSLGKDFFGGFADYVMVPYQNLRKIPIGITFEEATLVDSIAVAIHGYHLANSPKSEEILIVGDGSLALITGIICLEFNNKVTIIGKNDNNLALAKSFGITPVRDKNIKNLDKKYDIVFEVVGRKQDKTLQTAIHFIKPNGRVIVLGVFEKDFYGRIPLRKLFFKEGLIIGSNSYCSFKAKNEFDIAITLLKKLRTKFSKVITHVIPLKDFKTGLRSVRDKKNSKAIKIVFRP